MASKPGALSLRSFLESVGLVQAREDVEVIPLLGGVSSDIYLVRIPGGAVVVKRALSQLRVEGVWLAPVGRSAHEAAYLGVAQRLVPGLCPQLLHFDPGSGFIAMEYLDPEHYRLWKTELLAGRADPEVASKVGDGLGRIHSATAAAPELAEQFETTDEFRSLRLDPYLEILKPKHPKLAARIDTLIDMLLANRSTLVHGDVSPKNILIGDSGVVLLDAECAWWGDPAFDLAFCLNHLFLKTFLAREQIQELMKSAAILRTKYLARVDWEVASAVDSRAAALLPALLLARIDGLSPVEYFSNDQQKAARTFAVNLLSRELASFDELIEQRLETAR